MSEPTKKGTPNSNKVVPPEVPEKVTPNPNGVVMLNQTKSPDETKFYNLFHFNPSLMLNVGVERESFLLDLGGNIKPMSPTVLSKLPAGDEYGYELSACQLEHRVGPCQIDELLGRLQKQEEYLAEFEQQIGFSRSYIEVAPDEMPLDVYPDPTGRYAKISASMPRHVLLAACQVIGTHVHIGMPDMETSIRVYNHVINQWQRLLAMGDHSSGLRYSKYSIVAPRHIPEPYLNENHFYKMALENGFAADPRKCWTLIRISGHGTIEFRMFGATADVQEISGWARICHDLCSEVM